MRAAQPPRVAAVLAKAAVRPATATGRMGEEARATNRPVETLDTALICISNTEPARSKGSDSGVFHSLFKEQGMTRFAATLLIFCVGMALWAPTASGATITVTTNADSGPGSLRNAVAGAASGDTIRFSPGVNLITLASEIRFSTSITIQGSGPGLPVVSGNNATRIFRTYSGAPNITINSISLVQGIDQPVVSLGGGDRIGGGAVLHTTGTLTVNDCEFVGNKCAGNGVLFSGGGAILAYGASVAINRCTFEANTTNVPGSDALGGAAMYLRGTLNASIINCTFSANDSRNPVFGDGRGAIMVDNFALANVLNISLYNCSFVGNICDNFAPASAMLIEGGVNTATFYQNNLYKNNLPGPSVRIGTGGGTQASGGGNRYDDVPAGVALSGVNDATVLGATLTVSALANNGGPTRTHALVAGSSAIDRGIAAGAPVYDQRGYERLGAHDAGSHEFGGTLPNDKPVITASTSAVVTLEDTPVAVSVSISDTETATSNLVLTATSSNQSVVPNASIVQQGATAATTSFLITPAANANGVAVITIRVTDAGGKSSTATITITVVPVNDEPSFSTGANVTVNEDNGPYSAAFATGISDNDPEVVQTLTFNVSNNNNALFSAQPSINPTTGVLTFTPVANAHGVAVVSVYLTDNGGTANGGDDTSPTQQFTITVNSVNDEPSFTAGANVTVNEDNGSYSAAFATAISDNDPEVAQTLTFHVNNNNNALFSAQPSIDPTTGVLTFTPAANANGVAIVSVYLTDNGGTANGGDDTSPTQQFTITVNSVNDEPSFSAGADVTVNEDNGPYSAAFATAISDNDPEVAQTLTFNVSNSNNALFSAQPSIDPTTGVLTFTPAANANGVAIVSVYLTDNGGTANGGDDTSPTQQFTITVNSVNDEPSFSTGANVTVNEDNGPYSAAFATAISDNDPEVAQTLTFNVSNDNNALFSAQPSIDPTTGVLTFTPAANANGVAIVSVYLTDDGGTANGGDDTSPTQQFTTTVNSVNDEPSFTAGANVTVNEDNGPYSAAFATAISDNDPEVAQTLTFNVSNNNNALFSAQPSIDPTTGVLTFTPAANANGVAIVSVYLTDNGGTANGGDDTSPTQQFTITVNSVNDEPSFTAGADVTVNEDNGPYSAAFATAISDNDPEVAQTLTFNVINDNNALFSAQPSIDPTTGVLTFTPAANANGVAIVSVYLTDNGGTANGGDDTSPTQQFTITVNSVNDEPSFSTGANVTVNEDNGPYSAAFATAISDNDPEVAQTLTFNVSNSNNALFSAQPSISASGVLTFTPAANANGVAVVSVYLSDNGGTANGGDDTSPTQQFVITVNAVNDAPTFSTGANVTVFDINGPYNAPFATGISDGDPELTQTLTFNVSNNNNALFTVQPSIDPTTGNLSFTPALNANGVAVVSVSLSDNGGTANGGVNTSTTKQFTIRVVRFNNNPVAVNDAVSTCSGTALIIQPLTNDTDVDGDTLTISSVTQPANGSVIILGGNKTLQYTPPANYSGTTSFTYTVADGKGGSSTATITVTVNPLTVDVKVLLEGPYTSNGRMDTLLHQQGYIPLTSPYGIGGSVASIPAGAVDWILIEFRTNTSSASTVLRKAAFLKYNGTVIGANGNPLTLTASELPAGNYYIVVRHRNHLAIMSSNRASVTSCGIAWNFTTSQSQAYSTLQSPMYRVQISPAYYAMKAADPDGDGISTAFDRVMIALNLFDTGYEASDLDLDGDVDVSDVLIIQKHLFQFTQVP